MMFGGWATRLRQHRRLRLVRSRPTQPSVSASTDRADLHDIDAADRALIESVSEFTMTSLERRFHLVQAVRYVARREIPGAIVECGVWRGGSMMLVAQTLQLEQSTRQLYLFDTFNGMSAPTDADTDYRGRSAQALLDHERPAMVTSHVWAVAGIDDVRRNMATTGYPASEYHLVQGLVEQTIPTNAPEQIALLRLDTDWYESTAHELEHLYHRVVPGGVVIIDDYGYWSGARKAVDEFLDRSAAPILLHRIDDTCRAFIKPGDLT